MALSSCRKTAAAARKRDEQGAHLRFLIYVSPVEDQVHPSWTRMTDLAVIQSLRNTRCIVEEERLSTFIVDAGYSVPTRTV